MGPVNLDKEGGMVIQTAIGERIRITWKVQNATRKVCFQVEAPEGFLIFEESPSAAIVLREITDC